MIVQHNSNIKIVKVKSTEMLYCEGRACFEMKVNRFYKVLLNKTFRTNFSSLLNMVK